MLRLVIATVHDFTVMGSYLDCTSSVKALISTDASHGGTVYILQILVLFLSPKYGTPIPAHL